ncbi:MAG: family 43 glycosylhydrolase [Lactovum sp.]
MKFKKGKFFQFLIIIFLPLLVLGGLFFARDYFFPEEIEEVKISQDFADPSLLRYSGKYYAYSTRSWKLEGKVSTPLMISEDLKKYDYIADVTPTLPSWVLADKLTQAPEVFYDGERFIIFLTAFSQDLQHYTLAVGSSESPQGPFVFVDYPLVSDESKSHNILDASYFKDSKTEQDYVIYATDEQPYSKIYIQAIDLSSFQRVGEPIELLANLDIPNPENNGDFDWITRIEGPQLIQAEDGSYVLFFSANDADKESYFTAYAKSESLLGFYYYQGPLMTTATTDVIGPGGMSRISNEGGQIQVAFHGWVGEPGFYAGAVRQLYTANLLWESGSTPKLDNIKVGSINSIKEKKIPSKKRMEYSQIIIVCAIIWLFFTLLIFYNLFRWMEKNNLSLLSKEPTKDSEDKKDKSIRKLENTSLNIEKVMSVTSDKKEVVDNAKVIRKVKPVKLTNLKKVEIRPLNKKIYKAKKDKK